jgi:hypothetical protein
MNTDKGKPQTTIIYPCFICVSSVANLMLILVAAEARAGISVPSVEFLPVF